MVGWSVGGWVCGVPGGWSPMVLIFSPNGVNFFPLGLNFCLRGVRWPGGWWVPGWACGLLGGRSLTALFFSPNGVNFFPICCLSPPGLIFFPPWVDGSLAAWPGRQMARWAGQCRRLGARWMGGQWMSGCVACRLAGDSQDLLPGGWACGLPMSVAGGQMVAGHSARRAGG